MKQISSISVVVLAAISVVLLLSFQQADSANEKFKVGDVLYSVLNPQQFIAEHGSDWVLMDGRNSTGTTIHARYQMGVIPDARGMFVRGMNEARTDQFADPFQKDNNRKRIVGEPQQHEVGRHTHYLNAIGAPSGNHADRGHTSGFTANTNKETTATGGSETRPSNIALYVYVKVKD